MTAAISSQKFIGFSFLLLGSWPLSRITRRIERALLAYAPLRLPPRCPHGVKGGKWTNARCQPMPRCTQNGTGRGEWWQRTIHPQVDRRSVIMLLCPHAIGS
jgi:hypothetical protein